MFITLSAMASVGIIALIAVIAIIVLLVIANIKIVPQSKAYVIERLGAYFATWDTGLHVKIPFNNIFTCFSILVVEKTHTCKAHNNAVFITAINNYSVTD